MLLTWIDQLGDWNPQLLREFKGRLKNRNVAIAIALSLLVQFLLFQYWQLQLPINSSDHQYCTGASQHEGSKYFLCLTDSSGNIIINWQKWNLDLFVVSSIIGIFALLVAGTYLLISDLAHEERRGSLNFIRLSPKSTRNLLTGKLLGVPILLYLAILLAIPFHLGVGLAAQVSFIQILAFYGVVVACGILFYSTALLYALVSNWLVGFQAWIGSGIVLCFLMLNNGLAYTPMNSPLAWLRLLTPFDLIPHLADSSFYGYSHQNLDKLQWFYLPLGSNLVIIYSVAILYSCLWNYWIWQGLQRCFRNPNATIISKRQSYLLTAYFEVSLIGFSVPGDPSIHSTKDWLLFHLGFMSCLNLLLFLVLIAVLSPHRQGLHDWARYRYQKVSHRQGFWLSSLVKDLIWSEKSPAPVAIAFNLVIAIVPLSIWILASGADMSVKMIALSGLPLAASIVMIYAITVQLLLFSRTQHREIWATGVVGAAIFLPPIILGTLQIDPTKYLGFLWLFSVAAPTIPLMYPMYEVWGMTIFLTALAQWGGVVLLSLQLRRKLQIAGESTTKALLAGRLTSD